MSFKRTQLLVSGIVIFVVAVLGYFLLSGQSAENNESLEIITPSPLDSVGLIRVAKVEAKNESGQSGKVYWRDENGKVTVTASISSAKESGAQGVNIGSGSCESPGVVVHPLNSLIDGNSQTVLETNLADFESQFPLVLLVQNTQNGESLAACGVLDKGSEVVDPFEVYGSSSTSAN